MPCSPPFGTMYGGVGIAPSFATLPTDPTERYAGRIFVVSDTNRILLWDGSAWRGIKSASYAAVGAAITTTAAVRSQILSLVIPDQQCAGDLHVNALCYTANTVATDAFDLNIDLGVASQARSRNFGAAVTGHVVARISMTAGSGITIATSIIRVSGTGTASTFADSGLNRVQAIFIPT